VLSKNKSIQLFIFACIPLRIILALIPLYLEKKWLFYYSFILFLIGASFLYLYFTNTRQDAFEAGGKTWWAKYRIVHGLTTIMFSNFVFHIFK